MNIRDRCIVNLCRRSWRAYSLANATVTVNGIRVPIVGTIGLNNLDLVSRQFQTVLKAALAVRPGGYVVDVGANVGKFLLNLISLDRSNPYIGFEPLVSGAAYVRRLIVDNNLRSHSIIAVALGERCGTATIRFGHESDDSATLTDSTRPPSMYPCQQRVATSTADIQLADIESISFVKIDVEGTEISVLRGMTATLERHRPPMLIEVMPYAYLLDDTYDREYLGNLPEPEAKRVAIARREHSLAIGTFLHEYNYVFYACTRDGYISPVTTLDRGASKDRETDFLVLPSETANAYIVNISSHGASGDFSKGQCG
jgi:FkbM family methyltransferase